MTKKRNRWIYSTLVILVIFSGLSLRAFPQYLPRWFVNYAPDTLWALMIFLLVGGMLNNKSTKAIGISSLLFCYFIEITQLYHTPWIDAIRETTIGGLILGFGFLWSDLVCYTVGISIGVLMESFYLNSLE
ncbi:MAG: DUF2809 domain-containing protein [Marinisporobacter sp.]|jgi:hypothetical protein|nr:DUF2809 domain-containing protein [Marinisporobacter sp.]